MIFTFSIRDFGHPKFLKSQFGHPVMKILAMSLDGVIMPCCERDKPCIKIYVKCDSNLYIYKCRDLQK